MSENRCVCCGAVIPEGKMVCWHCENRTAEMRKEAGIGMTVKEFCNKYGVDYPTVYNATWLVKPSNMSISHREFDEEQLLEAVRMTVRRRADRADRELQKALGILQKIG